MDYVLSLSYGKDSLACLGAIEQLGWPLTRIVHAEVWATDTIPADLPPMVEFKKKADKIIKERWGIDVEHYAAKSVDGVTRDLVTFEDCFYHVLTKGKFSGTIKGFPMIKGNWCTKLKLNALSQISKSADGTIWYLGIALDEPNRFGNLTDLKRSPLVEAGWTENECFNWCLANDLLSPIYSSSARGGCWFCHNQSVQQLRLLRQNYPELWTLMLKWDNDSPVSFRSDGRTLHDLEQRFCYEDQGLLFSDEVFRWKKLSDPLLNYRLF